MNWLSGTTVFETILEDGIHADTQVEDNVVSLTAGGVENIAGRGELDFGGSEFQLAPRQYIKPEKRDPEDSYGWWELDPGNYLLELNEKLSLGAGHLAVIQPHEHLTWNGSFHPTIYLDEAESDMKIIIPLNVGARGINIKENARVSTVRVFEKR